MPSKKNCVNSLLQFLWNKIFVQISQITHTFCESIYQSPFYSAKIATLHLIAIMCPSSDWLLKVLQAIFALENTSFQSVTHFKKVLLWTSETTQVVSRKSQLIPKTVILIVELLVCEKPTLMVNIRRPFDTRNSSVSSFCACSFICKTASTFVKSVPGQLVVQLEGVSSSYEPVRKTKQICLLGMQMYYRKMVFLVY